MTIVYTPLVRSIGRRYKRSSSDALTEDPPAKAEVSSRLEDLPLLSIWLHYIPLPVLVLLVLLPGMRFRAAWRGRVKDAELHVRWPWWRRP
jgi:hypothetical protein